jgi:hypothetical protein
MSTEPPEENRPLKLNEEIAKGRPPLPDLDLIEVVVVTRAQTFWERMREHIAFDLTSASLIAIIAFGAGACYEKVKGPDAPKHQIEVTRVAIIHDMPAFSFVAGEKAGRSTKQAHARVANAQKSKR